jgi:hypothetical protein
MQLLKKALLLTKPGSGQCIPPQGGVRYDSADTGAATHEAGEWMTVMSQIMLTTSTEKP